MIATQQDTAIGAVCGATGIQKDVLTAVTQTRAPETQLGHHCCVPGSFVVVDVAIRQVEVSVIVV